MSDWADTEDHDYLNEWVGARIVEVTTGEETDRAGVVTPWVRLRFAGGRVVEIIAEGADGDAMMTVQDRE